MWLGGERVDDVVDHPAFTGAAHQLAAVFDRQHEYPDDCLMPDPETGESINVSHMIPRSVDDLKRRHKGLVRIAEASVGLMGRTPDYMNVTFAGFAGERSAWIGPDGGNEQGHDNLVQFQKQLAREDISLTHTLVHPTVNRATDNIFQRQPGAAAQGRRHRARHHRARRCASSRRSRRSPTRSRCTPAIRFRLTRRPSTP